MRPSHTFRVVPCLPPRLERLRELAHNLWWTWNPEAIDLFPGCSVSTNTMLLDRATAERILASTLGRIRLCVDTLNPDVYPTIRKGGKFEQVVGNIRTAKLKIADGVVFEGKCEMIKNPQALNVFSGSVEQLKKSAQTS